VPELDRLPFTRVVARPGVLDTVSWPSGAVVLRTAPDEVLTTAESVPSIDDPWAIIVDDAGWSGVWLDAGEAADFLTHACAWEVPDARPAFAQGMIAQLPVKVWFETDRVLLAIVHTLAAELSTRIERVLERGSTVA